MTKSNAAEPRDIFFVSNSVNELGGITSWSHQMARLFSERGHRVHLVGVVPYFEGRVQELAPTCRSKPPRCTPSTRRP